VAALVITAVGLTVTVSVNGVPLHPFMPGVIIYIALTGAVVVLVRDSLIKAVAPAPIPLDIPATTARVHEMMRQLSNSLLYSLTALYYKLFVPLH